MPLNILLVRFGAIGDILLTTPLIRALRERHPDARLTMLTRADFAATLEHNPRLSELIAWDRGAPLGPLARRIRGAGYTHRLDLHGSLRSRALRLRVGGRWRGYPKHRWARTVLIRTKRNVYRDRRPVVERYFDAADGLDVRPDDRSLEFFIPRPAMDLATRFLRQHALGGRRQLLAIAPGASKATKRWPLHHGVALARQLAENGNDVVVVGGPAEREAGATIAAGAGVAPGGEAGIGESAGRVVSAAGAFDLAGTAALLKRCRALVAGDTGVMHLATAIGTPVVALFGPTVEAFGFFPYHAKSVVLERDLPCRPCTAHGGDACPLKHHRCLQDLQPADVLEALRKLPR